MKTKLLLLILLLPILSKAQNITAFRDCVADGYNFWLYTPDNNDTITKKPLIIFLHGKALSGNDLYRAKQYGCINAVERGGKIDAFILNPQNPNPKVPWKPSKILNLLEWVEKRYPVDTNRIYVVGMSMGGSGTINFVGTYPEKVAAALAMCGGGHLTSHCGLATVPLWIIHGTADKAVSVKDSQRVADAIQKCNKGQLMRFDKLAGINHSQLARVFYMQSTYDWLFSHSLADSVRFINKDFEMTSHIVINRVGPLEKETPNTIIVDSKSGKSKEMP